jgi:general secretion pathway protein J
VVLLRPPLRISFAYAGPDRVFRDDWLNMDALPTAIMLTLRDAASERVLTISTVAPVHVNAPARSGKSGGPSDDVNDAKDDGTIGGGTAKRGGS